MEKLSNEQLVKHIFASVKDIAKIKKIIDPHLHMHFISYGVIRVVVSSKYEFEYSNLDKLIKDCINTIPFEVFPYELKLSTDTGGCWEFINIDYLLKYIYPDTKKEMQLINTAISNSNCFIFNSERGFTLLGKTVFVNKIDYYYLVKYQRFLIYYYQILGWKFAYK